MDEFPAHVAADWLGHSTTIADKHYRKVTDEHLARANGKAQQSVAELGGIGGNTEERQKEIHGNFDMSRGLPLLGVGDTGFEPDLMAWQIGDNGFDMRLSPHVPGVVKQMLKPWLCAQLARHALAVEDIQSWAIHPGGPRVLTACADSLGLDYACLQPSPRVLADYGNMSSLTILFILDQLRAQANSLPCVMLAFGPGLTIEAALFV